MKRCSDCKLDKAVEAFARCRTHPDGLQYRCRECQKARDKDPRSRARRVKYRHSVDGKDAQRRWESSVKGKRYSAEKWIRQTYKVDVETFARLANSQDLKCAGCRSLLDLGKLTHIDHDHVTGEIRGLLCQGCNIALGGARDTPETLRRLADYLERTK